MLSLFNNSPFVPHHALRDTTYNLNWWKDPQSSPIPSQDHPSSLISRHTLMPALVSALLSPLATNSKHGTSSLDGNQTTVTSVGQKQWDSNSLFKQSLYPKCQAPISRYMATIKGLSRAGGKATVGTNPPIPSSTESTSSQSLTAALSTLVMSQAKSTLPTIHHKVSTPQPPSSSPCSSSQVNSHPSLPISTQTDHPLNSMLANAVLCPHPTQSLHENVLTLQNAGPLVTNLNSGTRSSSSK